MARKFTVSFAPLRTDAASFLSWTTGLDFYDADFSDDDIWFCTTVFDDDDNPVVVIVFEFKTPFDAHFTLAVSNPRALSRRMITAIYRAVFTKAARITALVDPDNFRALRQVQRMGFVQEGYLRRGIDGTRDGVLFGLLPEQCPYLLGQPFVFKQVRPTHDAAERMQ